MNVKNNGRYLRGEKRVTGIPMYEFSKLSICVFLFYIIWFKYAYGERSIILYGSTILAVVFMIVDMMSVSNNFFLYPNGVLMNIIMCVYSVLTGFFAAKNQNLLLNLTKTYFAFSVACIIICYITMKEDSIDWLANTLIIINIVSALYVITQGYYRDGYGFVLGATHNPNNLGMNMDIALFCLAYKSRDIGRKPIRYILLAVLFVYVIIGCGSRKTLIAAGIMSAFWLWPLFIEKWKNGDNNKRFILIAATIVLLFCIYYFFHNIYVTTESYQRMQRLSDEAGVSSSERRLLYGYAMEYFLKNPLFGIGFGQYSVWNPMHEYSHSTYAEALANWGVIGCAMYFSPVLIAGKTLIHKSIYGVDSFIHRIVFALWAMEIFLGVGQIWFYEFEHILAWTFIYLFIDMNHTDKVKLNMGSRYVKN